MPWSWRHSWGFIKPQPDLLTQLTAQGQAAQHPPHCACCRCCCWLLPAVVCCRLLSLAASCCRSRLPPKNGCYPRRRQTCCYVCLWWLKERMCCVGVTIPGHSNPCQDMRCNVKSAGQPTSGSASNVFFVPGTTSTVLATSQQQHGPIQWGAL